jgi:recombination protein RecT
MSTTSNVPVTQVKIPDETGKKDISVQVLARIELFQKSGELRLPPNYSAENALKSAYLVLSDTKTKDDKPVLEVCTKESVAESLLKMVVWGLSPLKKQCDFIAYGNKLQCSPEYTGNIILAKRYGNLEEINANAVFKGDEFVFENDVQTGRKRVIKHTQTLETFGSKEIIGAYAVMIFKDRTTKTEIMNMQQIRQAWEQGSAKGNSPAHRNFPDQMAIKTVINRACKSLIRSSDDAILYSDSNDIEDVKYTDISDVVANEIAEKANAGTPLSFDPPEPKPEEKPKNENEATAEPTSKGDNPTEVRRPQNSVQQTPPPTAGTQASNSMPNRRIPF